MTFLADSRRSVACRRVREWNNDRPQQQRARRNRQKPGKWTRIIAGTIALTCLMGLVKMEFNVLRRVLRRRALQRLAAIAAKATSPPTSKDPFKLPFYDPTFKDFMFVAFYYPWYKRDNWTLYSTQGSSPMIGLYGSEEVETAEQHIEMALRGGIDAWAVSWWDQDSEISDIFHKGMMKAKNIHKIKFCMIYESMGVLPVEGDFANGTLALDKFISDMIFFRDTYFGHSSYLHINGRPVVYIYVTRFWKNFEPSMLDKIKRAVGVDILTIADDPYFGHNVAPKTAQNGIKNGKPVFDAYTSYNMYENELIQKGENATDYMFREALPIFTKWSRETVFFPHVLPKYHDFRDGHLPLKGDAAGLLAQLETFACLPRPFWYKHEFPDLMFVTSFNEWWEGTSVEPDEKDEYGYTFLDTIRAFKDSGVQCHGRKHIQI